MKPIRALHRLCVLFFGVALSSVLMLHPSLAQENKVQPLNWKALNLPEAINSPSALSISGNGKIAAHITSQAEIIIWDAMSTIPLERMPASTDTSKAKNAERSKILDNQNPAPNNRLPSAIALNADGSVLAIGYLDARVAIYSRNEKRVLREFKGHTGAITALAFSVSNDTLASGADDGTTQVWQVKTGKRLHIFDSMYYGDISGAVGMPVAIGFYANDRRLIVNEWYRGQYDVGRRASVWDLETGIEVETHTIAPPNSDDYPRTGMAVNPRFAELIYTGEWINEKMGMMLKPLDTCAEARQLTMGGFADTVAIDPIGRWLVAVDNEALMLFDANKKHRATRYQSPGKVISLLPDARGGSILSLVLLEHSAGTNSASNAQTSAYPNLSGSAQIKRIDIPKKFLQSSPFEETENLQTCSITEQIRTVQSFATPNPRPKLILNSTLAAPQAMLAKRDDSEVTVYPSPVAELFFTLDEQLLARYRGYDDSSHYKRSGVAQWRISDKRLIKANFSINFDDSALLRGQSTWYQAYETVKNLSNGEEIKAINNANTPDSYLYPNMRLDADSGLFFKRNGNTFEIFDDKGKKQETVKLKGEVLGFATRNGRLAVLFNNNQIYLWDNKKKQAKIHKLNLKLDQYDSPEELILSADANYLRIAFPNASGDGPTDYVVYHLATGKAVGQGDFLTDFPANSNRVVVADQRQHRLAVWDYDQGKIIARLPRHRSRNSEGIAITAATAISKDGRYLASASLDGLIRVWDLQQHLLVGELTISGEAVSLAFNHQANRLAVGKTNGTIAIVEVDTRINH